MIKSDKLVSRETRGEIQLGRVWLLRPEVFKDTARVPWPNLSPGLLSMHHGNFLRSCKSVFGITRHLASQPRAPAPLQSTSSPTSNLQQTENSDANQLDLFSTTKIASPCRVQKLIASQSDPLLAKEIFELASRQPNFSHSYSTFYTLIHKLGRARHFSLMESLLTRLKNLRYPVTPALFSKVIRMYGDAHLPEKALKTFYSMIEFNCKPTSKHLNYVLSILVVNRNFLRPAYDLFRTSYKYEVQPNTKSYNILMRAFCYNDKLGIAYKLFNEMLKREVMPDVESYRILMQGLCRKSQVNKATDLLEDMLNKGFVPDTLSYTTLLNSLCRKKQLREAYKLLCRMKVKGCNPNIVHYNTVILGLCRERRALDAIKVLGDMQANGCLPNLVSYRTLVGGLCDQGSYDEARKYMEEMMLKGFSPHFSVVHSLVMGLCNAGKSEEASGVLGEMLKHGEAPHTDTWVEIVPKIVEVEDMQKLDHLFDEVMKVEIKPHTRIFEAGANLEEFLMKKIRVNSRKY